MCGICGYVRLRNTAAVDPAVVYAMSRVMAHRGPDDEGVYVDNNAGLGMRRLAVIDLHTGAQPIHNEDRTVWIVCNGETYNFQDLRRELESKGHRFCSRTDTEAVLHGYEEWGEQVVRRLRGMFAFAVWDARRRRLLLARDRLGIKPLHVCVTDDFLVFGSEIKSLLCFPGIERRVDLEGLHAFLTFNHVPAPLTLYQGIKKVPPGHLLVCERGGIRDQAYWDLACEPDPKISLAEAEERLLALLEESVRLRLVSDVPLGVLLSGGVDSSAVTALATRALGRPVVASHVDGIPELVRHGETGLLAPPGDAGALARALDLLLARPTFALSLGRAAQAEAWRRFDMGRYVSELEALYRRLLLEPRDALIRRISFGGVP